MENKKTFSIRSFNYQAINNFCWVIILSIMKRFDHIRQRVTSFAKKQIKLKDRMNKPYNIEDVMLIGLKA